MKRFTYFLFAMAFFCNSYAEKLIDEVEVLPIAEKIESVNGKAISVIETGLIVDEDGQQVRGVHDVIITLDDKSKFGIHVNEAHILPGNSVTFKIDLSQTKNRLKFPVYPDKSGVEGSAPFTLEIPDVNISVCPEGSTIESLSCVKYEYAEITYLCPESHSYVSDIGKCRRAELTVASNFCPDGYDRVEGSTTCSRVVSTNAVKVCDDGFALKGNDCVKETRVKTNLCEEGFNYDEVNGECSVITSEYAPSSCPSGYELENGVCIERTLMPPLITDACGVDEIMVEGACHATAEFTLGCPDTYKNINNRCVKTQTCGNGYDYDHNLALCVKGIETIEPYVCPNTHPHKSEEDDSKCYAFENGFEKPNSAVNQDVCGENFVFGEGNRCVAYVDKVAPFCDNESISWDDDNTINPETGMCEEPSYLKPTSTYLELSEICPAGFFNNGGKCISNSAKPITDKCDVGFVEDDDSCIKATSIPPSFDPCPLGAISDDKGNCYLNAKEVCPEAQTLMIYEGYHICTPEFEVVNLGNGQNCFNYGLRFDWRGEKKYPDRVIDENNFDSLFEIGTCSSLPYQEPVISNVCERGEKVITIDGITFCPSSATTVKAEPICPQGTNLIGGFCQGVVITKLQSPIAYCQADFSLNDNNECVKTSSTTTGNYCGEVLSSNRKCVTKDTSAVGNYCKDGAYEESTQSCVNESIKASSLTCPAGFILNNNQCEKEEFIEMVVSCPSGYIRTSDGKNCIKSFTVAANSVCPDGWSKQGDVCSYYKSLPIESCPSGYVNKGNGCFQVVTADEICPLGFTNLGDGTCKRVDEKKITNCPSGYTLIDSSCYEVVSASQVCPVGFKNNSNGQCVDFDSQGVVSCPVGFTLENGSCYALSVANQVCPQGYVNNGDGECIDFDSVSITNCPTGFVAFNNQCYKTQSAKQTCPVGYIDSGNGVCKDFDSRNISSCPSGYVLNNGSCFSAIDVVETCPDNYNGNNDGICTRFITREPLSCESGFRPVDGVCREYTKVITTCPSGYTILFDGNVSAQCHKDEVIPVDRCNYFGREKLIDGKCYRTLPKEPFCPEGSLINSTECRISIETAVSSCPQNFQFENGSCHELIDATSNCPSGNGGICSIVETLPAVISCPSDYSKIGELCIKTVRQAPTSECPAGYVFNGSVCQKTTSYESSKTCDRGTYNSAKNRCEGNGTVEPVSVGCLFGVEPYYNASNDIYLCPRKFEGVDTPANVTCPDGTSTIEGGNCYVRFSDLPKNTCPSGGAYKGNGRCETTVTTSATLKCPIDFKLQSGVCEKVEVQNVSYSCPEGYSNIGKTCSKSTSYEADYSCPAGYALHNNNQCKKVEPTLSVGNCSNGLILNASTGKCTGSKLVPAVMTCTTQGYSSYDANTCITDNHYISDAGCPSGYKLQANGLCGRKVILDAEKSCPSGFYLYPQGCARIEPNPEKGLCRVGFKLNTTNGQCEASYTFPASYSCPEGFVVHDFEFCREESISLGVGQCISGFTLNNVNNKCERTRTTSVLLSCDAGYSLYDTNKCKSDIPDRNVGLCSSGFSLNKDSGECERSIVTSVTYECGENLILTGTNQCKGRTAETTVGSCPSGFELASNGKCERTRITPVSYQCPESFVSHQTSKCLSGTQDRSIGVCPTNYVLNPMGVCQKVDFEDVELVCGSGFSISNGDKCEATIVDKRIGNCPSQFTLNKTTGICEDKRTSDVELVCDPNPNYTLSGNQCDYYEVNPDVVISKCPEGYTEESNGQCSKVFDYEAIPLCPDGFIPDIVNDRCFNLIKTPIR